MRARYLTQPYKRDNTRCAVSTHRRYSRAWRDIFSERERARFWLLTDRFSFLLACFFFLRILYVSTTLWHHFILAASASFHLVCWLLPNSYIIHNRSPMAFYVGLFFLLGVLVEFLIHFMFSSAIYDPSKSISPRHWRRWRFLEILPPKTRTN